MELQEIIAKDELSDDNDIVIIEPPEKIAKYFIKEFVIVWHDPNVNDKFNTDFYEALQDIAEVIRFSDWKEATTWIKNNTLICHVLTAGTNGEVLLQNIFNLENVQSVHIFCM